MTPYKAHDVYLCIYNVKTHFEYYFEYYIYIWVHLL